MIFDMDGVLIDARDWHFEALNQALRIFGFEISKQDHIERFDGLPTRIKLQILSEEVGLPVSLHSTVNEIKQERTLRIACQYCFPIPEHLVLISELRRAGIKIGVATNSVRGTAEKMLEAAGLLEYLDALVTNEDVENTKPSPDIYLLAFQTLGVYASETVVVEDNSNGIEAAKRAGARVLEVFGTQDVNLELFSKNTDILK